MVGYHFTKTGRNIPSDACGDLSNVPDDLMFGDHPPGLEVDFRSNRINLQKGDTVEFHLVITCTLLSTAVAADEQTSSRSDKTKRCTPSQSLRQVVGDYPGKTSPTQQYLVSNPCVHEQHEMCMCMALYSGSKKTIS